MDIRVENIRVQIDPRIIDKTSINRAMALRYADMVLQTFGASGTGRPSEWPALSSAYAKRVSPPVPTLYRSGNLAHSIEASWDREAGHVRCGTGKIGVIAYAHQFGVPSRNLPARPFFPIQPNGQPTQAAQDAMQKTATEAAMH